MSENCGRPEQQGTHPKDNQTDKQTSLVTKAPHDPLQDALTRRLADAAMGWSTGNWEHVSSSLDRKLWCIAARKRLPAHTDPAEGVKAIDFAIEHGINFFDVSPYYGLTVAEGRLGEALEGYRDKVVLATKCGRYGADEFDFSAKRITASIDESLQPGGDRESRRAGFSTIFGRPDKERIMAEIIDAYHSLLCSALIRSHLACSQPLEANS